MNIAKKVCQIRKKFSRCSLGGPSLWDMLEIISNNIFTKGRIQDDMVFIFIIILTIISQTKSKKNPLFLEILGESGNEIGYDVKQLGDGSFIFCGGSEYFSSAPGEVEEDAFIARFGEDGDFIWGASLGSEYKDEFRCVQPTNDDELFFYATGFTRNDGDNILLAKFGQTGELIWVGRYGGSGNDIGNYLHVTDDEFVLITGYTYSFTSVGGQSNVFVLKVDPDGAVVWAKVFGLDNYDVGCGIVEIPSDNSFVVTGYIGRDNNPRMFIMKLSLEDGEKMWGKYLKCISSCDTEGERVKVTSDNHLLVTGSTTGYQTGKDVVLAKLTPTGDLLWMVSFGTDEDERGKDITEVEFQNTNNIVVAIGYTRVSNNQHLFLTFHDTHTGELVLTMKPLILGETGVEDYGLGIDGTRDGGIVFSGMTEAHSISDTRDMLLGKFGFLNSSDPTEKITTETCEYFRDWEDYVFRIGMGSTLELVDDTIVEIHDVTTQWDSQMLSDGEVNLRKYTPTSRYYKGKLLCGECASQTVRNSTTSVDQICSFHGTCRYNNQPNNNACYCDQGYLGVTCDIVGCNGIPRYDDEVCGGNGNCTGPGHCECTNQTYYIGPNCNITSCYGVYENDTLNVCSGHGVCSEYDVCKCTTTDYTGLECEEFTCFNISQSNEDVWSTTTQCGSWECFGVHKDISTSVCSGRGECESPNRCVCFDEELYVGDACENYFCGMYDQNSPHVCSGGRGVCVEPGVCECNQDIYVGELCQTNLVVYTVVIPILSIFSGFVVLGVIICCCCFACLFILLFCGGVCASCSVVSVMGHSNISQKARINKYSKLKNFDLVLQEQLLEENNLERAHVRINKRLFEIEFEDLELLTILGKGGSNSTVYKARWNNKTVAFKCFRTRDICSSQNSFDEFEREAYVLASVSHPNILRFFGCSLNPPRVGIVMEYCPKGDLVYYIKNMRQMQLIISTEEKLMMCYEIIIAMGYLHDRKVIHRDLKLENILVDEIGTLKVMDFGLSRIMERISQVKTKNIGTSYYMAPELITSSSGYNEKIDVYSFAICMYIIFTEEFHPYGLKITNIELRVAQNPNFRPRMEKLWDSFTEDEDEELESLRWIGDAIQSCWSHEARERPGFLELQRMFLKHRPSLKKRNTVMIKEPLKDIENNKSVKSKLSSSGKKSKNKKKEVKQQQQQQEKEIEKLHNIIVEKDEVIDKMALEMEMLKKRIDELENQN